ncbi:MAG: YafY family protein [Cyclonatronaceae bacterium]
MNSNERRLRILYMLQSGKKVTTHTLIEQFGISKRTVFRDLKVIQELGVPVTHYPEDGYGVLRDGLIPPIMFSFRELSVIMMGLSFVKSQVDQEMVRDAESVSMKIRSAVPASLQRQMNVLEQRTVVSPYIKNVDKRETGGDWFTICAAFVEHKSVSFTYQDREKTITRRTIDPYLLVHFTDHWNVIGYCHDRKALRNFVLSRMHDIVAEDRTVDRGLDADLDDILYSRAEKSIPVDITIAEEKAFSLLTELPGKITGRSLQDGKREISFLIDDLDFINEWLLRFGKDVKIRGPRELIRRRKQLLKDLLDMQD